MTASSTEAASAARPAAWARRRGGIAVAALLVVAPLAGALAESAPIPLTPGAALGEPAPMVAPLAPANAGRSAGAPLPLAPQEALPEGSHPRAERVQVQDLGVLDGNSIGVLDETHGGFGTDMWAGTEIGIVQKVLPALPAPTPWHSLRQLEAKLLLTAAASPAGKPTGDSLIKLRADKLWALGEVDGLNALLKGVPMAAMTPDLRRMQVDAALLAADTAAACEQAAALRSVAAGDSYPAKLQVFCQYATGKASEAGLGVDLLREQKVNDPAFFTAADALGGISPGKLDSFAAPTPVVVAMARQAKLAIPENAVAGTSGAALLRAVALMPNAPLETRLLAAEKAEAIGAVDTQVLRQLYQTATFTPQELSAPLGAAATDKGTRSRALLFRAAEQEAQPAAKAEVIAKALSLAVEQGSYFTAARLYAPQIAALKPAPELAPFAPLAARTLLAAQMTDAAKAWLAFAHAQGLGNDSLANAAAGLTPLARLAARDDRPLSAAMLAAWRKAHGDLSGEAAQRRAAVLYNLLAALGDRVPAEEWLPLYDGPMTVASRVPRPALWQGLRMAAEDLRQGESIMLAVATLGDTGLAQADPSELYRAVAALRLIGLDADARALAVEAAIANGV